MNYYPHHIGDYAKDTRALSQSEHGAYRLLMDEAYSTENGVDKNEIYAIACAKTAAERKATDRVIAKFFTLQDGRYHQKRIDEEVSAYQEKSAKASASAMRRWSERNANAMRTHSDGNANASETHMKGICETDAPNNQEPITNNQKSKPPSAVRARKVLLPENFAISDRVKRWAEGKGYGDLPAHFEFFVSKSRAKGYKYADWDEGFMGAIRDDWAGLRVTPKVNGVAVQDAWWSSREGIDRKSRELGIFARGTESYDDLKARIFERLRAQ